jgi:hypothetical protein
MDEAEARAFALAKAYELRAMTWRRRRDRLLDKPETDETTGPSGVEYQRETYAVWDDAREGDLRVFVAVDDGGRRAYAPLVESFIVAPDGSFVGE